jgi:small GTP-binding protein
MVAGKMNLGISFGTSFCRVAWLTAPTQSRITSPAAGECEHAIPTAFYAGPEGQAVGAAALDMLNDAGTRANVRGKVARDLGKETLYHLGDVNYSPVQVTSLILKELLQSAEQKSGGSFARAAIAYPVWFDAVAEASLRESAKAAGLTNATFFTQAQAVTIGLVRAGHTLGDRVLVVDIGGASTDLSVLAREPSGAYAVAHRPRSLAVGGDDFDRVLYTHIAEGAKRQAGHAVLNANNIDLSVLQACRLAKEVLSQRDIATFEHTLRNGSATVLRIPLSRADLERLARPKLEEVFRAASEALAAAANRSRPVQTVILTGAASLMPLAQRLAYSSLSVGAVLVDRGGTAAAVGAAWAAVASGSPEDTARSATGASAKLATATTSVPGAKMSPDDFDELPPALEAELNPIRKKIAEARARRFAFMLVGRTGVGKSSTLNSLFGRKVAETNRYERQTIHVSVHTNELGGIPFSIIDTPGLCDEDAGEGNDLKYLEEMRTVGKQIDSLWFVTRLDDTRLARDEKLTIKLISESFKPAIWNHAVIVFTHADRAERFSEAFAMRTDLIRREIARHAGLEIAKTIPAVAVDNNSPLSPDGKKWKAELYAQTFMRVSGEGLLTFALGTASLLRPRPVPSRRTADEREDRDDDYSPRNRRRHRQDEEEDGIVLSEQQERQLGERVHRESFGGYVKFGAASGAAGGAAGLGLSGAMAGAAAGAVGGPVGMAIGAVIGGAIGAVKGGLAGAVAGAVGGAVVKCLKRLFG